MVDSATRPRAGGSFGERLVGIVAAWARSQHELCVVAAEFADSVEWAVDGSPTAAHWLAEVADVEVCTAREWIRIGRRVRELPATAAAFAAGELSYSKVRTLTRVATAANEPGLVALASHVPAGELGRAIAAWRNRHLEPAEIEADQRAQRSVRWRTDPDGIVTFTLRLQPHIAAVLIALLGTIVMCLRPRREPTGGWPTLAQQHADAVETLVTDGGGCVDTEVVLHVRGDGCTTDDGTPVADTVIERIAPSAFLRALIHDADGCPVNASGRRRHPTTRQKRVVKERDRVCVDCGRDQLLEYDHVPAYEETGRTITDELELRCAPCHHLRHRADPSAPAAATLPSP